MFTRLKAQVLCHSAEVEDAIGVATLFLVLFLGLTFSGVA